MALSNVNFCSAKISDSQQINVTAPFIQFKDDRAFLEFELLR